MNALMLVWIVSIPTKLGQRSNHRIRTLRLIPITTTITITTRIKSSADIGQICNFWMGTTQPAFFPVKEYTATHPH